MTKLHTRSKTAQPLPLFKPCTCSDHLCLIQSQPPFFNSTLKRATLQDWAKAVMLGAQDSLLLSITPRFLAVDGGDTVTSLTVSDGSMRMQSLSGMMRSSVLLRLSCGGARLSKWRCLPDIPKCSLQGGCWRRMRINRGTIGCHLRNSGKRIHVM